jgi:hypothetical protein
MRCLQHANLPMITLGSHFISQKGISDDILEIIQELIKVKKLPKIPEKLSGSQRSLHLSHQWKIIKVLIEKGKRVGNEALAGDIFEAALEHLQSGGLSSVVPILETVALLIPILEDKTFLQQDFLPLAKSTVFELRKNEEFWPAYGALVKVQFHPRLDSDIMVQTAQDLFNMSELVQV